MRLACLILMGAGLAISIYLLGRHLQLLSSEEPVAASVCTALLNLDCDATLKSPFANVFGIPLAGWGVIFYGTLLALATMRWMLGTSVSRAIDLFTFLALSLGALIGLALVGLMASGVSPVCPLCLGVHAVTLSLFFGQKSLNKNSWQELFTSGFTALHRIRSGAADNSGVALQSFVLFSGLLCACIIFQWVFIQQLLHKPAARDFRDAVASFSLTSRFEIPIDQDDPQVGPAGAAVELVIFSDFQCPGCKKLARELPQAIGPFENQVRVVFKHFPLNRLCNEVLENDPHPQACRAAALSEAAHSQGKFWEFHDTVFQLDDAPNFEDVSYWARRLGLDSESYLQEFQKEHTMTKVKQDIELGLRLGVDETPVVFVGGRRAPDVAVETIYYLIMAELANQSYAAIPPPRSSTLGSASDKGDLSTSGHDLGDL